MIQKKSHLFLASRYFSTAESKAPRKNEKKSLARLPPIHSLSWSSENDDTCVYLHKSMTEFLDPSSFARQVSASLLKQERSDLYTLITNQHFNFYGQHTDLWFHPSNTHLFSGFLPFLGLQFFGVILLWLEASTFGSCHGWLVKLDDDPDWCEIPSSRMMKKPKVRTFVFTNRKVGWKPN